MSTDRLTNET